MAWAHQVSNQHEAGMQRDPLHLIVILPFLNDERGSDGGVLDGRPRWLHVEKCVRRQIDGVQIDVPTGLVGWVAVEWGGAVVFVHFV